MITLLLTLAFINLCALLTPGLDFFFVTKTAMSCSKKAALSVVAGVTYDVLFWSFLAFLGLNIIFEKVVWLKKSFIYWWRCIFMLVGTSAFKVSFF